jgi:hypothetical protein
MSRSEPDVLDAHQVPSGALVRDGEGDYYIRLGAVGSVAWAHAGRRWRAWGFGRFFWPPVGRFELVHTGVTEATSEADLEAFAAFHERCFGAVDAPETGAIVTTAGEVSRGEP